MKYTDGKRTITASPKAFKAIYEEQGFKPNGEAGNEAKEEPAVTAETSADVAKMNKKELLRIATEKGIEGASSLTKDELVAALKDVI